MLILGIESSCDETSVALVEDGIRILGNEVSSQAALHRLYGGVVPELAARAHLENLFPLLDELEAATGVSAARAEAVAFTRGPGLIGALLVGTAAAKGFAYARGLPLVGVDHLKAHLYAPCLDGAVFEFPLVGFVVSGGHTALVLAKSWTEATLLGATRDDAAGEAFDKVAALLGLEYPGGPAVQRAAARGDENRFKFPRGMISSGDFDFSFSGLKTAVRNLVAEIRSEGGEIPVDDVAAGFQAAVVDVLVAKLTAAAEFGRARTVVVGGGVAVNAPFRRRLEEAFPPARCRLCLSPPDLCGDNAAMVAGLAYLRLKAGLDDDMAADADPGLKWGTTLY